MSALNNAVEKEESKSNFDSSNRESSDYDWSDDEEQSKGNKKHTYYRTYSTNPTQSQKANATLQETNGSQTSKETQQSGGKPPIPTKPENIVPPNNRGSNTSSQPLNDTNVSPVKKQIQQFEKN